LLKQNITGTAQGGLNRANLLNIQIPLPSKEIQQKIVSGIEALEKQEAVAKEKTEKEKEKIEHLFLDLYNKANHIFRLSNDDIFTVSIGKRVLEADLDKKGTIPVYSANVFVPFGHINEYLITDFSLPSVLWGIDGDWMVNYIPAGKPFYPTDHCGVLRIKTNKISAKYLAWSLNKEGIAQNFSRTLRASIDRIKGLSIQAPPLSEQQEIVSEIENIEAQIAEAQKIMDDIPIQKNKILKKYL
jgi:type I restriction enzyme M protein